MPRGARLGGRRALPAAWAAVMVGVLSGCNLISGVDDFHVGSVPDATTMDSASMVGPDASPDAGVDATDDDVGSVRTDTGAARDVGAMGAMDAMDAMDATDAMDASVAYSALDDPTAWAAFDLAALSPTPST
jgi:hypothetical protein